VRGNLLGAVWRLSIFVVVCVLGFVVMMLVFAQSRLQSEQT
jgi:phospholipid/cholesterol/gamma-HCH transport system substrate-binding protein